ncbi:hypothetical protein OG225_25490 [Nocardia sp. NBC_01377]|uniref:hypothetical protein n=1 Tax=Nocardia TaxID=1817 RepID=UPI001C2508D3|nr:hypothetical protein [Nocardia noduli]
MSTGRVDTELDRRIASIRGESSSNDRSVAVETDPAGRITRLYVADYAMDDGPDRLAAILMEQHRIAHAAAIEQAVDTFESDSSRSRVGND